MCVPGARIFLQSRNPRDFNSSAQNACAQLRYRFRALQQQRSDREFRLPIHAAILGKAAGKSTESQAELRKSSCRFSSNGRLTRHKFCIPFGVSMRLLLLSLCFFTVTAAAVRAQESLYNRERARTAGSELRSVLGPKSSGVRYDER